MVKISEEIKKIRIVSKICKWILENLGNLISPGISTGEIEKEGEILMRQKEVISAFKGYRGYPGLICVSINEEVVHGIPSEKRILKDGDIVSLDVGIKADGYFSDCASTFPVGKVDEKYLELMNVTKSALTEGIKKAISGNKTGDISSAIQQFVEKRGFSVVREFAGHGVGRELHEFPEVPNFGFQGKGEVLKENMTIAIEPMVNEGVPDIRIRNNGWTVITKDGKRSAHFEDTVLVKRGKSEILTVC